MMKKLVMFCSIIILFAIGILAEGIHPVGVGTEEEPYQIATLDNLLWVSTNPVSWDKYFIQTADIDAAATASWNAGEGFIPIGTHDIEFTGYYNGNNHTISGLTINREESYQGLFGYCYDYNGIIENLGVINVNISGQFDVGALVGFSNMKVKNCYSTGIVNCSVFYGGGLIGQSMRQITSCYSKCTVIGGSRIGGLVGDNQSTIEQSYSEGDVSGSSNIGGFVGKSSSFIDYSYSIGNVTSVYHEKAGAFCGNSVNSFIWQCYSIGSVEWTGDNPTNEGFVGELSGNSNFFYYNFFDNEYSNQETDADNAATSKTTLEMKTVSTFTDATWDFVGEDENGDNDYWDINPEINNGYPYLTCFYEPVALPKPMNITITLTETDVVLSWDVVAGATSYKVYSSTSPYENFAEDLSGAFDATTWTAPKPDEIGHFYRVTALSE